MAATSTDRNTKTRYIERQIRLLLKAATTIPAGAIVATDATGYAVNAADTAGLIVQGRAEHAADYAAGDREIIVSRGVFCYENNAGAVLQADVGKLANVVDNQTVTDAATVNSIGAGYIEEVTTEGVWVAMLGGKVAAT